MKQLVYKLNILWVVLLLVSSCENDPIMFDSSKNLIGFGISKYTVLEQKGDSIPIYLGVAGSQGTTVTIDTSVTDLAAPAIEGTDFSLSTKTITFTGSGIQYITINPVNNDIFTGNKTFYLVITSNTAGFQTAAQNKILITLQDDEHPLKQWIGKYSVAAVSYGDTYNGKPDGAWDEEWNITTSAVEGDVTKLSIVGINSSTLAIIAIVDKDKKTITINPGQALGRPYGYISTTLFLGTSDIGVDKESNIIGTISDDGSIHIDMMGSEVNSTEYGIFVWDVFDTYWTKAVTGKNTLKKASNVTNKVSQRINSLQ